MAQYDFRSVGGSISDALNRIVAERATEKRQAMLDSITQQREARLAKHDEDTAAYNAENLKSLVAQREARAVSAKSEDAARAAQTEATQIKRGGEVYNIGNDVTNDPNIPEYMKTPMSLSSRSQTVTPGTPGIVAGQPTPQTPTIQGKSAPGQQSWKGTTEQRAREAYLGKPGADPRIKEMLEAEAAGLNTSGVASMFARDQDTRNPPPIGSLADYLAERYGPRPTQQQLEEGTKAHAKLNDQAARPFTIYFPGMGPMQASPNGTVKPYTDPQGNPLGGLPPGTDPQWANVVGRVTDNLPPQRKGQKLTSFARLVSEGNMKELADQIRQTAIETENVDARNQIMGRQTMKTAIADISRMLDDMQQAGVPTNILAGSAEDVASKLGTSTDPRYRMFSNRLMDMVITYRRAATGVSFGQREAADYASMFPDYKNTLPLNKALLQGMAQAINSNDVAYWTHKLGPEGMQLVFGNGGSGGAGETQQPQPTAGNSKYKVTVVK